MENLTPEQIGLFAVALGITSKLVDIVAKLIQSQFQKSRTIDDREKAAKNHILWPYIADLKKSQDLISGEVTEVKETTESIKEGLYGAGKDGGLISEIKLLGMALIGLERRVSTIEDKKT